ncbi:hypothetical protein SDC9_67201 [bioreactor metagenome]|uniref:Uncharacterized protein n=1 Tax=bioreactor metagenome TaxID=1076179 RepID=A0A644XX58_9ZZZZ
MLTWSNNAHRSIAKVAGSNFNCLRFHHSSISDVMQIFFVHSVVGMHGRNLQHVADKFARQTQTELRMRMHNIYLLFLRFLQRFVHSFDRNPAIFER